MTAAYEFFIKGQDKIVVTNVMKTINVAKIFFIINTSTKKLGTVVAHFSLKLSFFNSNYSRIMVQSSGHLATERPLASYNYQ